MIKKWYSFLTWYGTQAVLLLLMLCLGMSALGLLAGDDEEPLPTQTPTSLPVNECRRYCLNFPEQYGDCAQACDELGFVSGDDLEDVIQFATCHVICGDWDVSCIKYCIGGK